MKKLLLILLIFISLLSFPYYNNDYIDITHMINVSSIGIDYQNEEFTIYAYVINNYTMSKSDFNTSSSTSPSTIITGTSNTIENTFFKLYDSVFVNLNFSHIETLILNERFISTKNIKELILYISSHQEFYPKFNIFITKESLNDIFNIDYFSDTSSYYNILTEYKSEIEHHHTTFIDLINDFNETNYFVMYPSLLLNKNIIKNDKLSTSLYIDGFYYFNQNVLNKITYLDYPLLYLLYSTNDISFKYQNVNYFLDSLSIKSFRLNNTLYILFYSRSNFSNSLKKLMKNIINDLYKDNIDIYNLRYFNISTKDIKIISVEKINKKSIENE